MKTARVSAPSYTDADIERERDANVENAGFPPGPESQGYDHASERMTSIGLERRVPDNVPTTEEQELLGTYAIVNLARNVQRLWIDPNTTQAGIHDREDALMMAAEEGLSGRLIDPETRKLDSAFTVLRRDLLRAQRVVAAIENGEFAVGDDPDLGQFERIFGDGYAPAGTSRMIKRALTIVDRLEQIGSAAERQRKALERYRNEPNAAPAQPGGVLSQKEARFVGLYIFAEQSHSLFDDRDAVYETARRYELLADRGEFSPQVIMRSVAERTMADMIPVDTSGLFV